MPEPVPNPLPPEIVIAIERACDAFALAWKVGRRPKIEDHLGTVPEPARPVLLGKLLRIELEWRFRLGEEPSAEEYQARFASSADTIAELTDWLRHAPQVEAVGAVGFAVLPKKAS